MHTIILGGGVIGVSTAYYLARLGVRVTVLDRQPGTALETSFANAGQISPGYSTPWAAPGIPLKALKWLFQRHAPLSISPDGSAFQLQWMAQMLANCRQAPYGVNKSRMVRLAEYSRDCLKVLRDELDVDYDAGQGGTLQLFRSHKQLDAASRDVEVLRAEGVPFQLLTSEQLPSVEPALARVLEGLAGGLRLPNDETGDCHVFTRALTDEARRLGVTFRFGVAIESIEARNGSISGVIVDGERLVADEYVLALGSYSRQMALNLGIQLPVYPVKGYSLTLPIEDFSAAPFSTVLDETYKVALTRLGGRLRVGGMAELSGFDLSLNPRRRETLERVISDLFPGVADLSKGEFWTGLRPMTPDGTPIVGPSPIRNLWLNTGHGTLGWTMACGSAKVLASQMTSMKPEISVEGLAFDRYEVA